MVTLSTGEVIKKVGYDYSSIPSKGYVAVVIRTFYDKVGSKWKITNVSKYKITKRELLILTAESEVKGWGGSDARNYLEFRYTKWGRIPSKLTTTNSRMGTKSVWEIYYNDPDNMISAVRSYNKHKAEMNKPKRTKKSDNRFGSPFIKG